MSHINSISPGNKIYLIAESNANGVGVRSDSSSSGFRVTEQAKLTHFEITDIDGYNISFKNLEDVNTYKDKYINISNTNAAMSLSVSTRTYLTLDSDGRLSNEDSYFLVWNGKSGKAGLFNNNITTYYNMYLDTSSNISISEFASDMLNELSCDNTGNTYPSSKIWNNMKSIYNKLSSSDKEDLLDIDGNESDTDIEKAIAKYDYVIKKYNSTTTEVYEDFIGRVGNKITLSSKGEINIYNNDNYMIINITIIIGVISLGALLSYLYIKKNR